MTEQPHSVRRTGGAQGKWLCEHCHQSFVTHPKDTVCPLLVEDTEPMTPEQIAWVRAQRR